MLRKLFLFTIGLIAFSFSGISAAKAGAAQPVNLYFFRSDTCPHCAREKEFLGRIKTDYPNLSIYDFEISSLKNALILQKVGTALGIDTGGVPLTVIGNSNLVGFGAEDTTGQAIIELIRKYSQEGDPDPVGMIIGLKPTATPVLQPEPAGPMVPAKEPAKDNGQKTSVAAGIGKVTLPILGTVDPRSVSLPVLTFFIALLDGFNPCAMWTLLFLISLLLGMKDRRRMWILGIAFIATSAFVYFLFLSAWLNLFLLLGFVVWVRIAIGLVALGAGGYYLRDYFTNKTGGCSVMGDEKRQKLFDRIRQITGRKEFFLALGGIILLAIAVNLIELVCSAGLPAIYTQVLSLADLPRWQYYLYLIFYIFVFMTDDLIVFFTAMITLKAVGIESKYARISHLLGGVLMLAIGLLLLFKPEILMFL
jgi:hypothetical protein